ncbi:proteasome subunit alpha type-5 isoform X2 [Pelodiscus sinensis]|uniref:proteasome subunit alpha type-5 isoform X2 n=1 Tax=Pelodiscus sinensis TaxID=13735 RepID=UPI003F6D4015
MFLTRSEYDRGVNTFSPEGRLFQVEYAIEAIKLGSTAIGIQTSEGVCLAVEKRITSSLMEPASIEKIVEIDSHIGCAMSGLIADAKTLIDKARVETQNHWFTYNEIMTVESVTQAVSNLALQFGEEDADPGAMSRPFGVALLFGGVDEKGPQLFHMDPSGTFVQCDAKAIGSASEGAQSSLQEVYHKSMTLKEAIKSSLIILKQVMEEKLNATNIEYVFADFGGSVSLSWLGDSNGVILVLTTFKIPLVLVSFTKSNLYRSEDYGKTFTDITKLINHTFIRTEFGMAIGPENSGKVILTGDVPVPGGRRGGKIFRSSDYAKNFVPTDLPFQPQTQVMYHPQNSDHLLALSTENSLWVSRNFGEKWDEVHKAVCLAKWGPDTTIFFTTYLNDSCKMDLGFLELKKTKDFGKSFKTIGNRIYSFGLGGRFLFASVVTEKGNTRRIHVSSDQGDTWNMAQLPSVGQEQFFSILAANEDMVFMHVDDPGDTGCGTVYTSDDRGLIYSKSLERHLYTGVGSETDFTNVTSLRGVFITSVLSKDRAIQSVITFDRGGKWQPLRTPVDAPCNATKDAAECSLYIYALYGISLHQNVPMLPLSEPNAVGLVIAHGSVGDAIFTATPDVYISDDGGYTWARMLKGPHHYAILDSGGILVAIEHSPEPINVLKFSTDEGQCWHKYTFSKEPIYFTGLASEPGARSMNVSLWGYRDSFLSRTWVSYTIDFTPLLSRNCEKDDYTVWLAHSSQPGNHTDGCVLGFKEQYLRLRKSSVCQNGRDYLVVKQPSVCPCTLEDYLCDFGYFRRENQSWCEEQPELQAHDLEFCLNGRQELLTTRGYRRIPGDKCQGGENPSREVTDLKKKCTSNLLSPSQQVAASSSTPIILAVVCTMLLSAVAAVLIVKKYVCGGRFLVHRYSVLRQHAEASGVEGVDAPPCAAGPAQKGGYHDDSDEDLLE